LWTVCGGGLLERGGVDVDVDVDVVDVQLDSCGQSVEEACLREVVLMLILLMFNWIAVDSLLRRPA